MWYREWLLEALQAEPGSITRLPGLDLRQPGKAHAVTCCRGKMQGFFLTL